MRIGTLGTRLNLPSGPDLLLAYSGKARPVTTFFDPFLPGSPYPVYRSLSIFRFISDYLMELRTFRAWREKSLSRSCRIGINFEPIQCYCTQLLKHSVQCIRLRECRQGSWSILRWRLCTIVLLWAASRCTWFWTNVVSTSYYIAMTSREKWRIGYITLIYTRVCIDSELLKGSLNCIRFCMRNKLVNLLDCLEIGRYDIRTSWQV